MAYTVNKLAKLSGVSARTLRFYDEIGLLKPAYVGDNEYRYYEEEQLLMLQQILFTVNSSFLRFKGSLIVTISIKSKHFSRTNMSLRGPDRTNQMIKTIDKPFHI